jgi:hypothetical protein
MRETRTQHVGAYVTKNTPLSLLYAIGSLAVIGGAIISIAATMNTSTVTTFADESVISTVAVAWQVIGNGLIGLGALSLIGGAVAHAINWQILNR